MKPESWGGAIEVSILSEFYGIEIAVVDTQNAIINRFGEDKKYGSRVFLLFDGIHYDPLFMESFEACTCDSLTFILFIKYQYILIFACRAILLELCFL